jgi:hypothetical protein
VRAWEVLRACQQVAGLHAILNASGYLLDFSGREHPRWEDDPPLGLIHMQSQPNS